MKSNSKDLSAFLFPTYFWGFILIRPILQIYQSNSTIILTVFTSIILLFSLLNRILKGKFIFKKPILNFFLVLLVFYLDTILRYNEYSNIYLYKFIYSGLIPIIILSEVKDFKKLLNYFSYYSLLTFILYGTDPLLGYNIFSDYMDFGFNLALPAFIGMFLGYHYLKKEWMIIFVIICFFDLVFFANRSSTLSAVFFVIFYFLSINGNLRRRIGLYIFPIILLSVLVYSNLKYIILFSMNFLQSLGLRSYSLEMYSKILIEGDSSEGFFSGRADIWLDAYQMIIKNPIIGSGIASYQAQFNVYSHNLIIDILIFFGGIGLIFFILLISKCIKTLSSFDEQLKVVGILFLCLWFPKLFFSSYFLADIGFWCFLAFISFHKGRNRNTINIENLTRIKNA